MSNASRSSLSAARAGVGAALGRAPARGTYLTDGVFLYRVVSGVEGSAGEAVELEDCYALDVVRVSGQEVRRRNLQVVVPAPLVGEET